LYTTAAAVFFNRLFFSVMAGMFIGQRNDFIDKQFEFNVL